MTEDFYFIPYFFRLSTKAIQKIIHPKSCGTFNKENFESGTYRLAEGEEGSLNEGGFVQIQIVVDEQDGVIADFKYQCFGPPVIVATLEALAELALRKNYLQASRITYELVDRHLRDKNEIASIPLECFSHVNFCLSAFFVALEKCDDIPIAESQMPPASPIDLESNLQHLYPNFIELSDKEKLDVCEKLIQQDIRPYVQLDEGNVVIKTINGYQITIAYSGSCVSCFSALGSTLNAIQQIFRAKIHPNITVTPDMSNLGKITQE